MGKQVVAWTMLHQSLEEDPLQPFHTSCGPSPCLGAAPIFPISSSLPLHPRLLASVLIFLFLLCVVSMHINLYTCMEARGRLQLSSSIVLHFIFFK